MSLNVRNARAVTAAERRARVVALRRDRLSFVEIGRELGISGPAAWKLYQRALREIPAGQLEEHRAEELVLLDDAVNDLLKLARDHSRPRYSVEAWNCIVRISERRSRLLGLDAPTRRAVEVITQDAIERDIARLEQELLAKGVQPETLATMKAGCKVPPVPREPSRAELDGAGPAVD